MEKEKGHGDTSRTPPYPKKGDFNTPPVFSFLKRKRRLEICYFKTAVRLLYFVLVRDDPATETTVFLLFRCGWLFFYRSLPILELEVIKRFRSFIFTTVSNSFMASLAIQI